MLQSIKVSFQIRALGNSNSSNNKTAEYTQIKEKEENKGQSKN